VAVFSITNGSGSITITNTDLGSSQNIFKNIAVSGQDTVVADSNDDTLTFAAGSNITITTEEELREGATAKFNTTTAAVLAEQATFTTMILII